MGDQLKTTNEKHEQKKLLAKNFSLGIVSKIFYMATRLFLPPLTLTYVSLEEYGIWAACFIVIGYLGMSAFGVTNVYIRYTAEYIAKDQKEKINSLLSSGLAVTLSLSIVLLIGLWFGLPLIIALFKVSPELQRTAFILIFTTAATFLLDLTFGAFAYVLHGLQEIEAQTKVWVFTFCLEAILIFAFLLSGFGIYALMWAFVIRYVVATVAYFLICRHFLPTLKLSPKFVNRESLKLFYGYGAIVQINGLLSMILYSAEKVIAGSLLGVKVTGLFDVGEKFPVMASQITGSMNAALLPAMSNMQSRDWKDEIAGVYLSSSRYQSSLTGLMMGFMCAFAVPLMNIWMGAKEEIALSATILMIFTFPYQINELTGPASAFHRGANKPFRETFYPVSQFLLILIIVPTGLFFFGTGILVIANTVALSMIISSVFYICYSNRILQINFGNYFSKVLIPGLVPYLVGFGIFQIGQPLINSAGTNRVLLLIVSGFFGMVYLITNAALFYKFAGQSEKEKILLQLTSKAEKFGFKKSGKFTPQTEKL
ncbi:MAG: oligosaccharide flippase family protein [Pyrinomonadaceae bacterium]|nr:oligosaccharide flippase family protein [Pyrinomonadaceae bacterium]